MGKEQDEDVFAPCWEGSSDTKKLVAGIVEINQCLKLVGLSHRMSMVKVLLAKLFNTLLFDYQSEASSLVGAKAVGDWVLIKGPTPPQPSPSTSNGPPTPVTSHNCDTGNNTANANTPEPPSNTDTPDSLVSKVRSPECAKDDDEPPYRRQNTSVTLDCMRVICPLTTSTMPTTGKVDEPTTINKMSTMGNIDELPEMMHRQFPLLILLTPESYNSWDDRKRDSFFEDLARLKK